MNVQQLLITINPAFKPCVCFRAAIPVVEINTPKTIALACLWGAFMETFFAGPPADYAPPKLQVHIVFYDGKGVRFKSNVLPSNTPRNTTSSFLVPNPPFNMH